MCSFDKNSNLHSNCLKKNKNKSFDRRFITRIDFRNVWCSSWAMNVLREPDSFHLSIHLSLVSASVRVTGYQSAVINNWGFIVFCSRLTRKKLTSFHVRLRKNFPRCLQKPLLAPTVNSMHRFSHLIFTVLLNRYYSFSFFFKILNPI